MLDLNDVALFIQVVRAGSFAAASRKLGMPANTLSRRLLLLEESLGTRLLFRSTRKLSLTTAGTAFYAQCADGIADIEQAGLSLQASTHEAVGSVRVTAPVDFFDHFRFAWIDEFMTLHPKVQMAFMLDDRQVDLIAEGIDIAFRAGKLSDTSLVARRLADSSRGLYASPGYLARHGTPRTIPQLADFGCITAPATAATTQWKLSSATAEVMVAVSGRFQANTAQAQADAARAGLGIALLPVSIVHADVRQGTLVRILPDYRVDTGGLYVVSPSRRLRALAVSAFIDFVAEKLVSGEYMGRQ